MENASLLNGISGIIVLLCSGIQTMCFVETRFSRRTAT